MSSNNNTSPDILLSKNMKTDERKEKKKNNNKKRKTDKSGDDDAGAAAPTILVPTEEDFESKVSSQAEKLVISPEEAEKKLKKMRLLFKPDSDQPQELMSPITALYLMCRSNHFPDEFLLSLKNLENLDRSKFLGVIQMVSQMKRSNLGEIDVNFTMKAESYGMLTDELVSRVNGTHDKPVQLVDSSHMLKWISSRFSSKISILKTGDTSLFVLGRFALQQMMDKKFEPIIDLSNSPSADYLKSLTSLTTRLNDWTTWTADDCSSFSIGISSAVAIPVKIVRVTKAFYRYCISLLNLVSLSLVDGQIVISSLSSKLSLLPSYLSYNKTIRTKISSSDAHKLVLKALGTLRCQDLTLFSFSSLSYLLTYAKDRECDTFEQYHKIDYKSSLTASYPSSMAFLNVSPTPEKASAYSNLRNMESFYALHASNRRYRSLVDMGIQEYDTTYYCGMFERKVRRSVYLNQLFPKYCYIGLGSVSDPSGFKSSPDNEKHRFYHMGVPQGMSSTQLFIDLLKDIVISDRVTSLVYYLPIIRHEGISVLFRKMIKAGFKSVRMWPPDQDHSEFFPLEFSTGTAQGYDFNTKYSTFVEATGDTVLSVIMFNSMIRVLEAEKRYMVRVQLGMDNIYHGKFVSLSELPDEIISLTSGSEFKEVEFPSKPYDDLLEDY